MNPIPQLPLLLVPMPPLFILRILSGEIILYLYKFLCPSQPTVQKSSILYSPYKHASLYFIFTKNLWLTGMVSE